MKINFLQNNEITLSFTDIDNDAQVANFKVKDMSLYVLCGHLLKKGLVSWLSFVVSTVSLSLSHKYPGAGVVLDCIDS